MPKIEKSKEIRILFYFVKSISMKINYDEKERKEKMNKYVN